MKKILYVLGGIVSLFLAVILTVFLVLFFKPTLIVNEKNLTWALNTFQVFESWSWKKFAFEHHWQKWNDRRLTGEIKDFCFKKVSPGTRIESCFSEISWDFDLLFSFSGADTKTHKPFVVRSPEISVSQFETNQPKEESAPVDVYRWWSLLWSGVVPDMDVALDSIKIMKEQKTTALDFHLTKRKKELTAKALNFTLTADPAGFALKAPPAIEIPEKVKTIGPYFVRNTVLTGKVKKEAIPLHLTGSVEEAAFDVRGEIPLPLPADLTGEDFRVRVLTTIEGQVKVPDFKSTYSKRAPAAFRQLPAPLNVMDGTIMVKFNVDPADKGEVKFLAVTTIDLRSAKEVLDLDISADVDLPVMTMKPETVIVGLDFREVKLELPRLSKKSAPPQFLPDGRFKKGPWKPPADTKEATELLLKLVATEKKSMHLRSNLLDEPARLNFELDIGNKGIEDGYVNLLPLKTTVFRRPVHVKSLKVTFDRPKEPVITATIQFPLPEYKVTMELEGPVSKPRYAFRSEPPLPQNDIYAVLLFGRPLADLDPDDKTAAQKTNQILANGVLSLSVLYFLSGSPVEYVGFDPGSQTATAQFGLTKKTSLRVGGGQEGMNSGGLRHSLGKGWYIDTTVQDTQERATEDTSNYGVLLERVIAY